MNQETSSIRSHYPLLHKAIRYATKKHADFEREDVIMIPFIVHPIEVMSLLIKLGNIDDEEILCAAVLHDILESTSAKKYKLEEKFGSHITDIVLELTRTGLSKEEKYNLTKDEIWQKKNTIFLDEVKNMSREAKLIKLADRYSNLKRVLRIKKPSKIERYLKQTEEIIRLIPEEVNRNLWNELNDLLQTAKLKYSVKDENL